MWQGKTIINPPKYITNKFLYYLYFNFYSSQNMRKEWLNQKERQKEVKYSIDTFYVMRQGNQEERCGLSGTSLAVADQSLWDIWITPKKIGNLWDNQENCQYLLNIETKKAGRIFPETDRRSPPWEFCSPFHHRELRDKQEPP